METDRKGVHEHMWIPGLLASQPAGQVRQLCCPDRDGRWPGEPGSSTIYTTRCCSASVISRTWQVP